MGNLLKLQQLQLYGTKLSGESPKKSIEIKLSQFQARDDPTVLDTDTPTLQHSHVSGSIPPEISGLVALTSLDLSSTSIGGTLKIKEMKLCYKPLLQTIVFPDRRIGCDVTVGSLTRGLARTHSAFRIVRYPAWGRPGEASQPPDVGSSGLGVIR